MARRERRIVAPPSLLLVGLASCGGLWSLVSSANPLGTALAFAPPRPVLVLRFSRRWSAAASGMPETEPNDDRSGWIVRSLRSAPEEEEKPPAPRGNEERKVRTRLFLHLDINETILLGDEAGGDSRRDSVRKMLAKSAFCRLPDGDQGKSMAWEDTTAAEPTHWWDGQEMGKETKVPPLYTGWEWPEGCCPYYRTAFKRCAKAFTDDGHHGRVYEPVLGACEEALSGSTHILPAFYETLVHLLETNAANDDEPPFRLVFRTFGSDIDEIAGLLTDFSSGRHPGYPDIHAPELALPKDRLYQGRWKKLDENGSVTYELWDQEETRVVASGDEAILELLGQHTVCGIRDDYPFWKEHGWDPTAGKPVWVPSYDAPGCYDHHLLFDDNIHNLPNDGIACVRAQPTGGAFSTVGAATSHQDHQGVHLCRVPTVEPVLNPRWYIEKIDEARRRLETRLQARQNHHSSSSNNNNKD